MFYLKLAWNNLKNSLSVSAPFLLASTVLYMLNCIVLIILMSPISENMRYGKMLLGLAIVILVLFALISHHGSLQLPFFTQSKKSRIRSL